MSYSVNNKETSVPSTGLQPLKIEWADMIKPATKIVTFQYAKDDVAKEVEMRTSYLGKYRNTEQAAHLLDLVAMTKDESDLFETILIDTAAEVFDVLAKYTGTSDSKFVNDVAVITMAILVPDSVNDRYFMTTDLAIREALSYGVIYNWLLMVYPDEAKTYAAYYQAAIGKIQERSNTRVNPVSTIIPHVF